MTQSHMTLAEEKRILKEIKALISAKQGSFQVEEIKKLMEQDRILFQKAEKEITEKKNQLQSVTERITVTQTELDGMMKGKLGKVIANPRTKDQAIRSKDKAGGLSERNCQEGERHSPGP